MSDVIINNSKKRMAKYDNLKAFLIFCVIFGHLLRPLISRSISAAVLYLSIFCFHMGVFIYLTGKFAKSDWKRAAKFITIYFVFQTVYSIVLPIIENKPFTFDYFSPQYTLWFLVVTACYTLLNYILPKSLNQKTAVIIVFLSIGVAAAAGFCQFIGRKYSLSRMIAFLPFFLAGKYNIIPERPISRLKKWLLLFFTVTATGIFVITSGVSMQALYMDRDYSSANSTPLIRIAIIAIAFCWVGCLLMCVSNKRIPVITDIGRHTLFIFLGHALIVKLIIRFFKPQLSTLSCFVLSLSLLIALWGLSLIPVFLKKKIGGNHRYST